MFTQTHRTTVARQCAAVSTRTKLAGAIAAVLAALTLVLAPAASSQAGPSYTDKSGDSGAAADVTGVTVISDASSGQIVFRITGTNLSTSPDLVTMLNIDTDANPLTGDITSLGTDYWFGVSSDAYGFQHWNGSAWEDAPNTTVALAGGGSDLLISVNRSELGNVSDFNFSVDSLDVVSGAMDHAPDDGTFNYSLEAGGPAILAVALQAKPAAGPKAGRSFSVTPKALTLPPSGALLTTRPKPDAYSCKAKLGNRALAGTGAGRCTFRPAKGTRGKKLSVVVTVSYQGATTSFPFAFKVH